MSASITLLSIAAGNEADAYGEADFLRRVGVFSREVASSRRRMSSVLASAPAQLDDRQRVLDATDIVDLIGEHISLRPRGREHIGLCPFHDDTNPSMSVVPHKQLYYCFACGAGGNAIDFVIHFHKMDFREALRHLADRAGLELSARPAGAGARKADAEFDAPSPERLAQANRFALSFFRAMLNRPDGRRARQMLHDRGVSDEMIEKFQLGAAPARWDGLWQTASKHDISQRALLEAGLLKPGRDQTRPPYDAFRNRLIFPIQDQLGRPIAFGGRRLDEQDEPKYLNSPEHALFDKSAALYGLAQASRAIQRKRKAIVVEGYTDVIACHQAGIENVVATLGTSLTVGHAKALRRLCDTVVLVFDPDEAGQRAADRAVEVFFAEPVDVKIALPPDGLDPADLLASANGVERFIEAIDHAQDALEHRFARLRSRLDGAGIAAKTRIIEQDIARLSDLGLKRTPIIRRRLIVRQLANLAGVEESMILAALESHARRRARRRPPADSSPTSTRDATPLTAEEHALACLLHHPALRHELQGEQTALLEESAYENPAARQVLRALLDEAENTDQPAPKNIHDRIEDESARRLAMRMTFMFRDESSDGGEGRLRTYFYDCVQSAMRRRGRQARREEEDQGQSMDWAERLRRRQLEHQSLGGDPSAMPRPVTPKAG